MSPVDPLPPLPSPTSPMDISPTSAIEAGLMLPMISPRAYASASAAVPPTPVLAASDGLPRLVTTFQNSNHRCISSEIQFALLTPSPLTLRSGSWSGASSPKTAVLVAESGRPFGIRYEHSTRSPSTAESVMSLLSSGSGSHRRQFSGIPATENIAKPPTLCRQNAMEGFEKMDIDEDLPTSNPTATTRLPIRPNFAPKRASSHHAISAPIPSSHSSPTTTALPQDTTSAKPTTPNPSRKHTRSSAISKPAPPPRSTTSSPEVESSRSYSRSRSKSRSPQVRRHQRKRTPTPKLNIIARDSQQPRREKSQKQAHLRALLTHLSHPLVPLVSVKTGRPHPDFPRTLLSYNLLTHDQLDGLARHYHQTLDAGPERWLYPAPVAWGKTWCGSTPSPDFRIDIESGSVGGISAGTKRQSASLEAKRRRWGRFIGLRGCESPVAVAFGSTGGDGNGDQQQQEQLEEEDVVERMERQWREALRRAEEERNVRDKLWGRRS